jgi:hypothetical protein
VSRSPDRVHIGSLVTTECLFDFLILRESLVKTWTYFPFELHAFVLEDGVERRLADAGIDNLEVHRLPGRTDPADEAATALAIIEHSGVERCIVSHADNLFLAETPELMLLLHEHDLVFAGGRSLWSFRRSERSIKFVNGCRDQWPPAPERLVCGGLADGVAVLPPGPYTVNAADPQLLLVPDWLGLLEDGTRQVKVLHFAGLQGEATESVAARLAFLIDRYPRATPVLALYAPFARRAALRIGVESIRDPHSFMAQRLIDAAIPPTRNQLPAVLNRRGLAGTGVEVGVMRGDFSETILEGWRGGRLISVDPWLVGPRSGLSIRPDHDRFYEHTVERLAKFEERSEVWRMTSVEAAAVIESKSLDFVYIDAMHDYDSVREDLEHWFDKVRPGGLLAGHDYFNGPRPNFRVKEAVDEFFGERGLQVKTTYAELRSPSWVVEIPAEDP